MMAERSDEDSALTRLRRATASSHRALESLVESLGLLESLDGFARHLALLHDHCASHYHLLAAHPDLQALVAQRRDELHADLQRLGRGPRSTRHHRLLFARTQPPPARLLPPRFSRAHVSRGYFSRAQCFGFTYVTEGSRLGALAIAKRLNSRGIGTEELQSLGRSPTLVRERWFRFCEQLSTLAVDEWNIAAAAAVGAFRLLQKSHLAAFER